MIFFFFFLWRTSLLFFSEYCKLVFYEHECSNYMSDNAVFWCRILVPEYGYMQLQLIPMLVGFFTYKIATFTQAIEEAITIVGQKTEV